MTGFLVVAAVVVLAALAGAVTVVARAYSKVRGARVVTCPETRSPAGVRVDAWRAALAGWRGRRRLQLESCTRWPERAGCGQECLAEIASAPDGCLVRTKLARWYAGRVCVLCGKEFGVIDWHTHKPALMDARRRTFEWNEVQAVEIPGVLGTHQPVCWDCHVIARLCREHPERVVLRH